MMTVSTFPDLFKIGLFWYSWKSAGMVKGEEVAQNWPETQNVIIIKTYVIAVFNPEALQKVTNNNLYTVKKVDFDSGVQCFVVIF